MRNTCWLFKPHCPGYFCNSNLSGLKYPGSILHPWGSPPGRPAWVAVHLATTHSVLWAAAVYLAQKHKNYWICAIPATFMSAVSMTYFTVAPECLGILWKALGMEFSAYYPIGLVVGGVVAIAFFCVFNKKIKPYATAPALVD